MERIAEIKRKTKETDINIRLNIDGTGQHTLSTGIAFFDHMLTLFSVHGFFDLSVKAKGDLDVDFHHTVEDVGLVMGDVMSQALGDRKGINRYGYAVTPMDDALAEVAVDLSNRPYLVYHVPLVEGKGQHFDLSIAKEFFRAFSSKGGMNLHINVKYGDNEHHIIESIFKSVTRALNEATAMNALVTGIPSSKGTL